VLADRSDPALAAQVNPPLTSGGAIMLVASVAPIQAAPATAGESAVVPAAEAAQVPDTRPAVPTVGPEIVAIDPVTSIAAAFAPVPVLSRGDWAPARVQSAGPRLIGGDRSNRGAALGSAAERCRLIVVKAQLGEDPSHADRDFLRRGCPAER
jgi:hypothetical protein